MSLLLSCCILSTLLNLDTFLCHSATGRYVDGSEFNVEIWPCHKSTLDNDPGHFLKRATIQSVIMTRVTIEPRIVTLSLFNVKSCNGFEYSTLNHDPRLQVYVETYSGVESQRVSMVFVKNSTWNCDLSSLPSRWYFCRPKLQKSKNVQVRS